jgi:hypothetical protein
VLVASHLSHKNERMQQQSRPTIILATLLTDNIILATLLGH